MSKNLSKKNEKAERINERRMMRKQAFELVFEKSFGDYDIDAVLENAIESRDMELYPYAERAFKGVFDHLDKIDGCISQFSRARSIRRLSKVVLAVLRLAIYEMLYEDDIDGKVSINEAVELAKTYASVEEARFVNGLLGGVYKNLGSIMSGEDQDDTDEHEVVVE